jgi:hypothetical protein
MIKNILFFVLAFWHYGLFSQGLVLDNESYLKAEIWTPSEAQGYAGGDLPLSISYRKYTPRIQNQGTQSTCVGWAVAYAQLSTQQNLLMRVSNGLEKWSRSMDPYYVYNYINSGGWCQEGTRIVDAMEVLRLNGTKPFIWDPWLTCNAKVTYTDFTTALASNYRISDYQALGRDNIVANTKMALADEFIVSVGMNLTESFQAGAAVKYGVWAPSVNERFIGGHAMCVVGYDDLKYGGAFEIMNSWGSDYGDNGFVWIKYTDFYKYVSEAWVMLVEEFKPGNCSLGDCNNSYSRYRYSDGTVYEGLIENGELDIYGAITYPNGNFYVGQISRGRKHGYGVFFNAQDKAFFNVLYNRDVATNYEIKQGYASDDELKTQELLNVLIEIVPDSKIETDPTKIEDFIQKAEVPEKPLVINMK